MYFQQVKVGGYDENFAYLVGDEKSREIAVVDPDNLPLLRSIIERDSLKPVAILVTHEHFDHLAGVEELALAFKIPVYIHFEGRHALPFGLEIEEIADGDVIDIGAVEIQVLHTPGHAPGAVCYLVEDKLITGDTLFVGGCGRCDLEGGDIEAMYRSLYKRLKKLPDHIKVYPGHDYGDKSFSTIGEEKKSNPYLICSSKTEFIEEREG